MIKSGAPYGRLGVTARRNRPRELWILNLFSHTTESGSTLEDVGGETWNTTLIFLVKPALAQRRSARMCGLASENWQLMMTSSGIIGTRISTSVGSKRRIRSRKNAELPIIHDLKLHMQYPAVFVHDETNVDFWKVRCLAILINRGWFWYAHKSRVTLCEDDMSVIPPFLRPACEGGLVRGRGGASQPGAIACRGG